MNEYANYASKLFEVFRQHLPSEVMATQFPAAIVAIVIGVGVCVLGAKLARWLITIIFASAGMVCGLGLGKALGFSSPISALGGGLALGGVGMVIADRQVVARELADGRLVEPFDVHMPATVRPSGNAMCAS